ncbi:recombinase family protein [Clostridium boliviensis]|uniref:Recombinase family protein n=1 Tax=Clostridium boliviensis TaxID=318465 RepID=A0ABU4GMM0_9CLOT|nr:recombinase family protein [Clostridium boliviensis]MDW2798850.1 recombinase family protein [Clostridium boliviensis]
MENRNQPFAIYSRKSKFTGKGESIGNQIELCRQYITAHYGESFADNALVFEDEGFSGGNLERPQFQNMMKEAKKKNISAIVCYRLDRISRNIGDFANLIGELNHLEISFISIKEQFDTSSPMGRAMMYIASVFSQLERETIAERIRDNMHELSKSGRWLGGNTPTGYQSERVTSVTIDGKQKRAYKLKRIPQETKMVKRIYEKFLETGSLTGTETYLIQNGYKTKQGRLFSRFAIKGILTNPVYMIADQEAYDYLMEKKVELFAPRSDFDGVHGVMAYNRTMQKQGRAHEVRDMEEWIVAVGKHEGLIPGTVWVRVQRILERNKSKNYRKPRSNVALLSGILICQNCHNYMRPKLSGRYNDRGEQIYSYLCSMKEKSRMKCCAVKNANGNELDRLVIEELKKIAEDKSEFIRQLEEGKKLLQEERQDYELDISRLSEELGQTEKEIDGLVSSLKTAGGTAAQDYIVRQIDELHKRKEQILIQVQACKDTALGKELTVLDFELLKETLSTFEKTVDCMDVEQKRSAIRILVQQVVWDGDTVHLYLFGSKEPSCDYSK